MNKTAMDIIKKEYRGIKQRSLYKYYVISKFTF